MRRALPCLGQGGSWTEGPGRILGPDVASPVVPREGHDPAPTNARGEDAAERPKSARLAPPWRLPVPRASRQTAEPRIAPLARQLGRNGRSGDPARGPGQKSFPGDSDGAVGGSGPRAPARRRRPSRCRRRAGEVARPRRPSRNRPPERGLGRGERGGAKERRRPRRACRGRRRRRRRTVSLATTCQAPFPSSATHSGVGPAAAPSPRPPAGGIYFRVSLPRTDTGKQR